MNPVVPDLAVPIRSAILANTAIVADLATYLGVPAVFTRRPAPADAVFPMIIVGGNVVKGNRDGIHDNRPFIQRDVAVYGSNETAEHYRTVETLGDILYAMFHRVRNSIVISDGNWHVVDISCTGPIIGPVDDDHHIGRIVTLNITLGNPAGA